MKNEIYDNMLSAYDVATERRYLPQNFSWSPAF